MSEQGRILVIDDSETLLARVEARLTAEGYDVITTTQTIGNARHLRNVDLIIIDYHMPGIDGGDVVKSLRQAARDKSDVLLYVYTSDEKVAERHALYGFDGAFTQKGNLDALSVQVRAALKLSRTRALREKLGPASSPASSKRGPSSTPSSR